MADQQDQPRRVIMFDPTKLASQIAETPRPLSTIAAEIRADWKNLYIGAKPYLEAMRTLDKVTDNYGVDSGESIVLYFLVNAQTWRGPVARRVKAELKGMVKRR